jgi:hypothetical protein
VDDKVLAPKTVPEWLRDERDVALDEYVFDTLGPTEEDDEW